MHRNRLAIVTGYFPPSNLAGVHRSRLWAKHLPEFGWEPIVVTAHSDYYEEQLDPALLELVSPDIRVIRTKAISVKRVRFFGDIGIRAFYWQFKILDQLIRRNEIDFIHITIPSNYTALLGQALYQRHRFPFGIDYQDPWVHIWPGTERLFSKAWMSCKLARWLEPWAVKNAALITGVAPAYYEAVLERNPQLRDQCITAAMPIGDSAADFESIKADPFLFKKEDGLFHLIYAGAMLPSGYPVLVRFLEALVVIRQQDPQLMEKLRVHFVGTGKSPDDASGHNIVQYVRSLGLESWVDETPQRISYVNVLTHLREASAILIVGSTESHYSPSKIYQAVRAKRPVFALLHEQSSAVGVVRNSRAGCVVTLSETRLPPPKELASALASFIKNPKYSANEVNWHEFEAYSARNSARLLAAALNNALKASEGHKDCKTNGRS